MSMSELHKPEWYGEYAVIKNKYNDYVQVEYKMQWNRKPI